MKQHLSLLVAGLLVAGGLSAHEGESHEAAEAPLTVVTDRPRHEADGALQVSKSMQRRLGLRTTPWSAAAAGTTLRLVGEVGPRPEAALAVVTTEPGRLEAPDGGWPLPGRKVRRGEVLAWLRPALTQREIAERRAQIADLDQKLIVSQLTVERMRLQKAGAEDTAALGNVYYEQSVAENGAMVEQRRLLDETINGRFALKSPADGVLAAVRLNVGDVASAGQTLFELTQSGALRIAAMTYDAQLADRLHGAQLVANGVELMFRGVEPLSDTPGWRLLFDAPASAALNAGQLVDLALTMNSTGTNLPPEACVLDRAGRAQVWLHIGAEHFRPVEVSDCARPAPLATLTADARIVTAGAALLTQY